MFAYFFVNNFAYVGGDTCPEFCESMSFDKFIDLLKRRVVMGKDIELLMGKCYKYIITAHYNDLASKRAFLFSPSHEAQYLVNV